MTAINPAFIRKIENNLAYWQQKVAATTEVDQGRLDEERQNLFQAVQFGMRVPQTQAATARLAQQLFNLVERRGYWREWIPVLEQVIAACTSDEPRLRARLLAQLGWLYRLNRALTQAITAHEEAEALARQLDDLALLAAAHAGLGADYLQQRRYDLARQYALRALVEFVNAGAPAGDRAGPLNVLGMVANERGDWAIAEERFRHAADAYRQSGRLIPQVRCLNNLAVALQAQSKHDEAAQHYAGAAALLEDTDYELDKVMVQISLGSLLYARERYEEAEAAFRRANSHYLEQSGHLTYRANVLQCLGITAYKRGRLAQAEAFLRQSLALWQQAHDEVMLANTQGTLAELLAALREVDEAVARYDEAIALLERHPQNARARRLLNEFKEQRGKLT